MLLHDEDNTVSTCWSFHTPKTHLTACQHETLVLWLQGRKKAIKLEGAAARQQPPAHIYCTQRNEPLLLSISPHLPPLSPVHPPKSFQLLSFQSSLFYINTLTSFPECRDRKMRNKLPRAEPLRTLAEPSAHMLAIRQYVLWLNSILAKGGKGLLFLAFQT